MICIGILTLPGMLFGCSGSNSNDPDPLPEEKASIQDYFPMLENVRYVYEGKGNEYATYETYTEYTFGDKMQQRVENGGTVVNQVYQVTEEKVTRLLARGETYYRENMLEKGDMEEVLLMEPLEVGTTWSLKDGRERTITSLDSKVETPSGSYKAIEVITESKDSTTTDYYAKGVGLVKSVFASNGVEISSSLKEMEADTDRVEMVSFYYPNIEEDKIYYINKEVSFKTNDVTSDVLEKEYKESVDQTLGVVIPEETRINELYLDENNKVRIDLSTGFVQAINAGGGYESMILQSIANTFGHYYNAEEVIITIDKKPYESGHLSMKEDQSVTVDFENAVEFR